MKKLIFNIFCIGVLACVIGISGFGCNESEPQSLQNVEGVKTKGGISDHDFCRYIDLKNIHKTIPIVNRYIDNLPQSLDAGQRAEALVAFFKSFAGIVDSRYFQDEYMRTPAVFFSFMDDGTERELALDFSTTGKVLGYHYDVVTGAVVKTRSGFTIEEVFDFINSLDFDVDEINGGVYISTLPSSEDNLQCILDELNAKPYTNDGNAWQTTGYLHYQTGQITIFTHLFGMRNREYQADWLRAMDEYELTEKFADDRSGYVVEFVIPEDATIPQSHWDDIFAGYDFLNWFEMNCNRYTLADDTMADGYEEGVKAVDSKIYIRPVEIFDHSPRTIQFHCATEKIYPCCNYPIITAKRQSTNSIDISFKGVDETEFCFTATGPATTVVDLGPLAEGSYTLNLYNGDVLCTGRLVVTAGGYFVEIADNDTFDFPDKQLSRMP